ncbi:MAG: phosphoenolpyruvate--protein phosphotransferase [Deferribacteraceae bacterium]|jgi:phosphoenolpyruvate-protein phosphotransferase|nr:phosphoenolpyruvate--protein phosphotransferase [Deferribacteraceae bacterium]
MSMKLFSPVSGVAIPIESVDDLAFAAKMLGDGLAVRPALALQDICSPVDGVVVNLSQTLHAVMILAGSHEILIHIGVDTIMLKGEGFKAFVKSGDTVTKGQKLLAVDFAAIAPKVPSIDVITVITNLPDTRSLSKSTAEKLAMGDELYTINDEGAGIKASEPQEEVISPLCEIVNEVGIHARPSMMISQIAVGCESVQIKKGNSIANAKSIAALMGLNARYKDQVQIIARGAGAATVVEKLMEAIKSGLGEAVKVSTPEPEEPAKSMEPVVSDFSNAVVLNGLTASPGFMIGKAYQYRQTDIPVVENASNSSIAAQIDILDTNLRKVSHQIKLDIQTATDKKQSTKVDIYKAHLGILRDEAIIDEAKALIKAGKTAAFAWRKATETSTEALSKIDNPLLKERLLDFKDVERRVIRTILGLADEIVELSKDTIVIARDLVPSDLAKFDHVAGFLLANGSTTSHVSLIIRNIGLPCVVVIGDSVLNIPDNTSMILDATDAKVTVNPEPAELAAMREKQQDLEEIRARNVAAAKEPAITTDGLEIAVKGNISNAAESKQASELGAEGVGLFRTEFMFLGSTFAPDAETHRKLYQEVVDVMDGGKITIRMLDVGGDKPISYIHGTAGEENPIIGLRGVRNYSVNMAVIMDQIRGILQIKPIERIKIMIPMVTDADEFIWIKSAIEEEKKKMGVVGELEIGTMIEVPSAALISEHIGKYADFFSIGTNDLTQYTLAMDRGNVKLAPRLNNMHPALLRMIKLTVEGGNKTNTPTAVCGAMASQVQAIPLLIGLGVTELSTSMKSIPDVKALVRTLDSKKCKALAEEALTMESANAVMELVKRTFNI